MPGPCKLRVEGVRTIFASRLPPLLSIVHLEPNQQAALNPGDQVLQLADLSEPALAQLMGWCTSALPPGAPFSIHFSRKALDGPARERVLEFVGEQYPALRASLEGEEGHDPEVVVGPAKVVINEPAEPVVQNSAGAAGGRQDSDSDEDMDAIGDGEAADDEDWDDTDFEALFAEAGEQLLMNTISEVQEAMTEAARAEDFDSVSELQDELAAAELIGQDGQPAPVEVMAVPAECVRTRDLVAKVYRHSRPRLIELLSDTTEPFIVDADALLCHVLRDARLDKSHGGQPLHAAYLFNKLIDQLATTGAPYHIVFFESNSALYGQDPVQLLLRTTLIQDLQQAMADQRQGKLHLEFSSCCDPNWREFVHETAPIFLLLSDAEQAEGYLQLLLRTFLSHCIYELGVTCVFVEGLSFNDDRIEGFATRKKKKVETSNTSPFVQYLFEILPQLPIADPLAYTPDSRLSPRLQLVACAVASMLNQLGETTNHLARAFVMHAVCIEQAGLAQRAFAFKTEFVQAFRDYAVGFAHGVVLYLLSLIEQSPASGCSVDLFDGRAFFGFAGMSEEALNAAFARSDSAQHCWEAVATILESGEKCTAGDAKAPVDEEPTAEPEEELATLALPSNALIDSYLRLEPRAAPCAAEPAPAEEAAPGEAEEKADDGGVADSWEDDDDVKESWEDDDDDDVADDWENDDEEEEEKESTDNAEAANDVTATEPAAEVPGQFHENSHWHTDLPLQVPLEPAFYTHSKAELTAEDSRQAADQSFEELLSDGSWALRRHQKKTLARKLNEIQFTEKQWSKAKEVPGMKRKLREQIHAWLEVNRARGDQLLMRAIKKQADTLFGAIYHKKKVVGKKDKASEKGKKTSSKAAKILKEKEVADMQRNATKELERYRSAHTKIQAIKPADQLDEKLKMIHVLMADFCSTEVRIKKFCFHISILVQAWAASVHDSAQTPAINRAVEIVQLVIEAATSIDQMLKEPVPLTHACDALSVLGFATDITGLPAPSPRNPKHGIPNLPSQACDVGCSIQRFQLEHMAHLLPRNTNSTQDQRVQSFRPDDWQRNLLDTVDAGSSALICAPTSSGKTFIASYVIQQVLQSEDEHAVAVFVLPTKALVNQVQAQVYKDFGTVFGVFTRDYRYRPMSCRVLITVPACLEILVLSPANRAWVDHIKYCIFDEVHCVSEADGGVLERTMLYMPCPMLALSATIGNVEEFHGWMQFSKHMQRQQDMENDTLKPEEHYHVAQIVHTERWSDLHYKCYPCDPECADYQKMVPLHPITTVTTAIVTTNGWGPVTFAPAESIAVYDAMCTSVEHLEEPERSERMSQLSWAAPEEYFSNKTRIIHPETRAYERRIKGTLQSWAKDRPELFEGVLSQFRGSVDGVDTSTTKMETLCDNFSPLLHSLRDRGSLPVLVFNFDRSGCMRLLTRALEDLERAEAERRSVYADQLQSINQRLEKENQQAQKAAERAARNKKDDDDDLQSQYDSPVRQQQFIKIDGHTFSANPDLPDPDFTFTLAQDRISEEGLQQTIRSLRMEDSSIYVRAMRRGIGIHHSGLPTKYRQAVEILFREKHLKVVVATGTLAYGIHMPCKAVVFAGESVFLNALQFRQMSGRAGRRGFDPTGEIVFFGIPFSRSKRLLLAPVPRLRGRFPITMTRVLRLLLLQAELTDSRSRYAAPNAVQQGVLANSLRVLEASLMCHIDENHQRQARLIFSAVVRTLVQLGMVDPISGVPIGLAGLATHLFWTEPANIGLVRLLQSGAFHQLLAVARRPTWEIVRVLSYLFCKVELHPSLVEQIEVEGHQGPSLVLMDPMPEWIAQILSELESDCLGTFVHSLRLECEASQVASSCSMPFTHLPDCGQSASAAVVPSGVVAVKPAVCSPFVALSGGSDEFASAEELALCCHTDLAIQSSMIPAFMPREQKPLNSYILDFCKHGQKRELFRGNCISEATCYENLKTFGGILKATASSLQQIGEHAPEMKELAPYFSTAATEFNEAFELFNSPQYSRGLQAAC